MLDIAIIGGGPAGLAAGLYAARGGASVTLFEELFSGGQAAKTSRIDNYPGFAEGIDGFELGMQLEQHATKFGLTIENVTVESLALSGEVKKIVLSDRTVEAKTVILATGATPRKLGVDREEELTGAGVSYCATCDGAFFKGKDVAVIGGGDTALSDALYLTRHCNHVYVVHRRDALRGTVTLQKSAMTDQKIEFVWDSTVCALEGDKTLSAVIVKNKKTEALRTLPVAGVFVAVGILPNSGLVKSQVNLAEGGAIMTDVHMATNIPGVFAAGDVRDTVLRQVITACADGAVAATSALEYCNQ